MLSHDSINNVVKVLDLAKFCNTSDTTPPNLRAEYNAIKVDNGPTKPKALYLTSTVPERVFTALDAHFATNYVVDFPPYQLERVAPRYGDDGRKAYLTLRGKHISTVRWNQKDRPGSLVFQMNRALDDGAIIAKMTEAAATVANQLQTFADCPLDYAAPVPSSACGTSYGQKTLAQLDTMALKITEGDLPFMEFDKDGLHKAGEYYFHEQGTGGKLYGRKASVWTRGVHVANVLWDARQSSLEGSAKLEITNSTLYDTTLSREAIVDNPVKALNSNVIKPFRADIAFDSPGLMTFLNAVHDRNIEAVRQSAYHKAKKYVSLATDEIEGFSFGSRSAGRFVRCYNKTKELETSKKEYISEFHKINGIEDTVARLEVELKGDYFRTLVGFDWRDLFDREKMVAIGQQALSGWFDWVPANSTDSKRNRRQRVTVVDFSQVKKSEYKRQTPAPVKSDRMERIIVKSLILRAEASTTDAGIIEHLQTAASIAEKNNLWCWMQGKIENIETALTRRARLEERELSKFFKGRCWYEALIEAYGSFQPLNHQTGELASVAPLL